MKRAPSFDDIFDVMGAASVGDLAARVELPDDPKTDDLATRFAVALNLLLDDLAQPWAELAASEARKTAILESALDSIISMDHEGKIVEFNPAAEKMFGYSSADVIGKSLAELIIPAHLREKHRRGLAHYLATAEGSVIDKTLELTGMSADGSEFPVELTVTRVELPGPPLFTGYLRDLTERKQAEAERWRSFEVLQKTDEERRTLLAHLVTAQEEERKRIASNVHDDSIQIMAAVSMRLGMLRGRLSDPDQLRQIQKIEEVVQLSIGRLRHLLFRLAPPALEREGLVSAIRTYMEEAFGEEEGVDCQLESELKSEPPRGIRTLVYRIAQEALSNVRKHAQARRVRARLEEKDGGLLVSIRDDGVGYSPADSERPQPGHLGVVSMRERAEMLGGWFRIEGTPGSGTTVEIWVRWDDRFPASVESAEPGPPNHET